VVTGQKISVVPLHDEVLARLRERILTRELRPGQRIDEMALVSELGISRTPLREALKVLQSEGLVTLVPRRGCFVTELSEKDLDDIYETVALLESHVAAKAAQKISDAQIEQLFDLHGRMEAAARARSFDDYRRCNTETHHLLQSIAGNAYQQDIISNLRRLLHLAHYVTIWLPNRLERSIDEHRRFIDAIAARNVEQARHLMHEHIMNQRAALRQIHQPKSE